MNAPPPLIGVSQTTGNIRELQNVLKRVIVLKNWEALINELFISDTSPNKPTLCYMKSRKYNDATTINK